jgi:hypothetical protein
VSKVTTALCIEQITAGVRDQADVWPDLDLACEGFAKRRFAEDPANWREVVRREEKGRGWVRDFTLAHSDFERDVLARVFSGPRDEEVVNIVIGYVWEEPDFYFCFGPKDVPSNVNDPEDSVTITRRDVFDRDGRTSDQSEADGVLPEDFYRLMESEYEFEMGRGAAMGALLQAGFVHKPDMYDAHKARIARLKAEEK